MVIVMTRKLNKKRAQMLRQAMARADDRYGSVFKRLAE